MVKKICERKRKLKTTSFLLNLVKVASVVYMYFHGWYSAFSIQIGQTLTPNNILSWRYHILKSWILGNKIADFWSKLWKKRNPCQWRCSLLLAKWKVCQSGWKFVRIYYHLMLTLQKKLNISYCLLPEWLNSGHRQSKNFVMPGFWFDSYLVEVH